MKRTGYCYRAALMLALALTIAGTVAARAQASIDINGAWTFAVVSDLGPTTATVTFKIDAGKATGHLSSPMFGEQDLTGTFSGQSLEFAIAGDAGQIAFKATAESNESLKGSFENPGVGNSGTFTAKRRT